MAGSVARVIWQRAATKRCLLHEDVKQSTKLSHLPCDFSDSQSDKTYLISSNAAEEKDAFTSIDSWSVLSSECSSGKMSNMNSGFTFSVQKDYQSALDESFMFRFYKNDEFDSLKAENVSLDSFADLKTLLSGEAGHPELGCLQELSLYQGPKTDKSNHLSLEDNDDIGDGNEESIQTSKENATCGSEVDDKIKLQDNLKPSSLLEREHELVSRARASSLEGSKHLQQAVPAPKLQSNGTVSWRTADSKELAALVARKSSQHMENCDLPPSKSQLVNKGVLESWDLNPTKKRRWEASRSMDKGFVISFLHGYKPVRRETRKRSSSKFLGPSDPLSLLQHVPPSPKSLPSVSEQITPSNGQLHQILSSKARDFSCSAGEGDRGPQLLGEALCRSQTRAREAEKAAAQALLEKERVTRLLFREASISLTYRQWVKSLQAENICLRLQAGDRLSGNLMKQSLPNSCTSGLVYNTSWRHSRKEFTQKELQIHCNVVKYYKELKRRRRFARSDGMAGYSIGLAFAFGLSLAGAGLLLGWSMGWILFAPLGN